MKTLIWKIRFAVAIRRLLALSWCLSWQMAGNAVESLGADIDIWSPEESAEEERDA
jgi:hypothetical protein